ncbi:MlaA family lipoprotein [Azospirillum halopraeferens]|uniref:MlaA family lipoprotein n=1 Tax=Azospirillum halopraeferens TaxID=34010 RepID=UPI00042966D9|nr:VacJ family lipoprotein [Azospirillum halopraeferens]
MLPRPCAGLALAAGLALLPAPALAEPGGDPFERFNRAIYGFNAAVQDKVLVPATRYYVDAVPEAVRSSVSNALSNLREPLTALNSSLQGDLDNAGAATARFAINSTFGVLGLFDAATGLGFESRSEDLGQTLCTHGMPEGAFLVLPLIGPTTTRDLTGAVVTLAAGTALFGDAFTAFVATDRTVGSMEVISDVRHLERSALDPYAAQRSAYRQHRRALCSNGDLSVAYMPDDTDTLP